MHPLRKRRLILITLMVCGIATATGLALYSFNQNLMFYFTPTDVAAGKAPSSQVFRVGGLVVAGSVNRATDKVNVSFVVTDLTEKVTIHYAGILPDLFREGQGIIARGRLNKNNEFIADEVLAKHDEKYMPPEVEQSLKKNKP